MFFSPFSEYLYNFKYNCIVCLLIILYLDYCTSLTTLTTSLWFDDRKKRNKKHKNIKNLKFQLHFYLNFCYIISILIILNLFFKLITPIAVWINSKNFILFNIYFLKKEPWKNISKSHLISLLPIKILFINMFRNFCCIFLSFFQ